MPKRKLRINIDLADDLPDDEVVAVIKEAAALAVEQADRYVDPSVRHDYTAYMPTRANNRFMAQAHLTTTP